MGCGKSTVMRMLAAAGFKCIDTDALVRDRVQAEPVVRAELREHFGDAIFDATGRVDRPALAARVFADEAERRWLEDLIHPRVFAIWRSTLQADPMARWAVEVPLLFEKQLENWFDFAVCVASAPEQQLARLEHRGLPRTLARQRISKQLPLAQKTELSDIVLWNDGPISFLQRQVDLLVAGLPDHP
jgi:dephospho-CoA kinase